MPWPRLFRRSSAPVAPIAVPVTWTEYAPLLESAQSGPEGIAGNWAGRKVKLSQNPEGQFIIQMSCQADLWCRRRTSVTTMLDPSLFEIYTTGDPRIDEDWIVQTNPPSAFRREFEGGCTALLDLLKADPALHATREWLTFRTAEHPTPPAAQQWLTQLAKVAVTAERELRL